MAMLCETPNRPFHPPQAVAEAVFKVELSNGAWDEYFVCSSCLDCFVDMALESGDAWESRWLSTGFVVVSH